MICVMPARLRMRETSAMTGTDPIRPRKSRWVRRTLRRLFPGALLSCLAGCFLTVDPVFTADNSDAPESSPRFQEFLAAARQATRNLEPGEIHVNIPLSAPAIDLRVVEVPASRLVIVQELIRDYERSGDCAENGCYIYYGAQISEQGRPERCDIALGFYAAAMDDAPLSDAARRHSVGLQPLVDNARVRAVILSGDRDDIHGFILEQFSEGPFDCSIPAITGRSGYERRGRVDR